MEYKPQNFDHLLGAPGFSDQLLKNHFTLYQGYVANTNKFAELLKTVEAGTPAYAELKRRFGWEFNGMRLHEYYFGNMKSGGAVPTYAAPLWNEMEKVFGKFENWEKDFKAVGAMRGIGWAVLYYDPAGKSFFNTWVNEHDMGHLAGAIPLLVLDIFEHAYAFDYGIKKADYIEAFFNAIDWGVVEKRFQSIEVPLQ